jgi:hypothetical protein
LAVKGRFMAGLENVQTNKKASARSRRLKPERGDAIVLLAPIVVDGLSMG